MEAVKLSVPKVGDRVVIVEARFPGVRAGRVVGYLDPAYVLVRHDDGRTRPIPLAQVAHEEHYRSEINRRLPIAFDLDEWEGAEQAAQATLRHLLRLSFPPGCSEIMA